MACHSTVQREDFHFCPPPIFIHIPKPTPCCKFGSKSLRTHTHTHTHTHTLTHFQFCPAAEFITLCINYHTCSSHFCPHIVTNLYSVLLNFLSSLYHVCHLLLFVFFFKGGLPRGGHCYPNPGATCNTLRWGHTAEATTFAGLWPIPHWPHNGSGNLGQGGLRPTLWLLRYALTVSCHLGMWSHRVLCLTPFYNMQ